MNGRQLMTSAQPCPIYILGGGSIGILFASSIRLAWPSYPLTLLLRPHHRNRLRPSLFDHRRHLAESRQSSPQTDQLRYRQGDKVGASHAGSCIVASLKSASSGRRSLVEIPAEIVSGSPVGCSTNDGEVDCNENDTISPIRNLILSTKAPDAADALRSVAHRLDPSAAKVVVLTNGALAVRDEVEGVLRERDMNFDGKKLKIVLASTTHGAHRFADEEVSSQDDLVYSVVHAGVGRTYVQDRHLATLFNDAGLRAEYASEREMEVLLWKKLATNCAINPLTALRGCTNGELLTPNPGGEEIGVQSYGVALLDEIIREVSLVAMAEAAEKGRRNESDAGESITEDFQFDQLRTFVMDVIHNTSKNTSSMLQDVLARRHPTEIQYLNGYVSRIGRSKHGIETPVNSLVCKEVERLTESFLDSHSNE